jgi:hypothetical protein
MSGRSVAPLRIPVFGSDKIPVQQIFRVPVSIGTGDEHIILSTEPDHCRIGTRTVGNVLVGVIDHIGIIYVQRVAISILPHVLRKGKGGSPQSE